MRVPEVIYSTVANKCPQCHKGKVFKNNNPYSISEGMKMNETCTQCHLKYEKEPGFFYGSMYVAYALTSGLFIVTYFLDSFFFHMPTGLLVGIIAALLIGLYPVTFRWARILWLNFFVRYNKDSKEESNKNILTQNLH